MKKVKVTTVKLHIVIDADGPNIEFHKSMKQKLLTSQNSSSFHFNSLKIYSHGLTSHQNPAAASIVCLRLLKTTAGYLVACSCVV